MFCPDCGAEVAEGRKFCGKCGGQLRTASASVEPARIAPVSPVQRTVPAPAQPPSPRRKGVYALVVLLAVMGGAAWWWFNRPAPAYKVQDPGIYPFQGLSADGKTVKTGFIDADGNVLIQPEWDSCAQTSVSNQLVACNEGLCGIYKDGKWGYIDTNGRLAIPNQFDYASPFIDGLASVKLGNQFGYIDKTGQYVINPQFNQAGDFHEGMAAVHADGGWGFINKTGVFVIKPHLRMAPGGFSDGLSADCHDGKCGYIDRNGIIAIKPQFDFVSTFSEGLASVQLNGKMGYVNTSGKIVINPQFDVATTFYGGLAVVTVSGKSGTINKAGKYVVNPGQYNIQPNGQYDVQEVLANDGYGLLTRDGKWVIKPSKALTEIGSMFGKVFEGKIGGQFVPISISGKVLAGAHKGAMLDTLGQDLENQDGAAESMRVLIAAESNFSGAYPAKGFTTSLGQLGPATGTPDENHAGLIQADLASGTKDGYQFAVTIPEGTSTGGTNFNYFIVAKPAAGHVGRTFCADSSGAVHYGEAGQECTVTSPTL